MDFRNKVVTPKCIPCRPCRLRKLCRLSTFFLVKVSEPVLTVRHLVQSRRNDDHCMQERNTSSTANIQKHLVFLRVHSLGVIWITMSDPRSVWIIVHQRNRRIHSGHGFFGSFDAPIDPDRSWIGNCEEELPKKPVGRL